MSRKDNDGPPEEVATETTSAFRDDFLGELDRRPRQRRGPDLRRRRFAERLSAAHRRTRPQRGFPILLDQPSRPPGRRPDGDIFLDDISVSRRHAEFQRNKANSASSIGGLDGTYVVGDRRFGGARNRDEMQVGKFRLAFLTRPAPS